MVDAFFAAAHRGDFKALIAVLDPSVVLRTDGGTALPGASGVLHGAAAVARRTLETATPSVPKRPALVNGAAGVIVIMGGQLVGIMGFTVSGGKITHIDVIADPARVARFDLAALRD